MIESSAFGVMTIDGRTYHSDLIIFPDKSVKDGWWRRRGHVLSVDDVLALADTAPETIVAGTGTSGRMRPEGNVKTFLREKGIEFIAEPTSRALKTYNKKVSEGVKVGACFHLTC